MSPIRVLIADDHRLFRQGLAELCRAKGGFDVVGQAENGQQAVELARRLKPDVILMDVRMPVLDGVQATGLITAEHPEVHVIVLTMYREDGRVFDAIRAGGRGYLLKDLEALRAVHRAEALLDSSLTARLFDAYRLS